MKRNKHSWHCGVCGGDLLATRKGKGTKYLFCPKCDNMMAYYNRGLLSKIAKGTLRSIPGGDIVAELLPDGNKPANSPQKPIVRRLSPEERVEKIEKLLRGR